MIQTLLELFISGNCMMMISEISKDEDFEKVAKKSKSELKLSPSNKHELASERMDQKEVNEQNNNSKKIIGVEPEWQSELPNEDHQEGKKKLACLLLSLELHKMGLTYPSYEAQINEYISDSDIDGIPLNYITYWVSKNKNFMVNLLIPNKNRESQSKKSSIESLSQKMQIDENSNEQMLANQSKQKEQLMCSICLQISHNYEERQCKHNFCNYCVRMHILQCIDSADYELGCPMEDCKNSIEDEIVQKLLIQHEYQKYKYFKRKNYLEKNPLNKFCSKPDCGQLLEELGNNQLKCPLCSCTFCSICLQEQHSPNPCDKTILQALRQTYEKLRIKQRMVLFRNCPKCSAPIQKIDGCNHMVCKKCKAEFCWICLSEYSIHHYRYYNCFGCPGLQFGEEEELPEQKCKQAIIFLLSPFILLLLISGFFICLPLYMTFCLLTKPCDWIGRDNDSKCEIKVAKTLCCCVPECLQCLFSYFLLLPRAVLYAVFLSPIRFCCYLCHGAHDAIV